MQNHFFMQESHLIAGREQEIVSYKMQTRIVAKIFHEFNNFASTNICFMYF